MRVIKSINGIRRAKKLAGRLSRPTWLRDTRDIDQTRVRTHNTMPTPGL